MHKAGAHTRPAREIPPRSPLPRASVRMAGDVTRPASLERRVGERGTEINLSRASDSFTVNEISNSEMVIFPPTFIARLLCLDYYDSC